MLFLFGCTAAFSLPHTSGPCCLFVFTHWGQPATQAIHPVASVPTQQQRPQQLWKETNQLAVAQPWFFKELLFVEAFLFFLGEMNKKHTPVTHCSCLSQHQGRKARLQQHKTTWMNWSGMTSFVSFLWQHKKSDLLQCLQCSRESQQEGWLSLQTRRKDEFKLDHKTVPLSCSRTHHLNSADSTCGFCSTCWTGIKQNNLAWAKAINQTNKNWKGSPPSPTSLAQHCRLLANDNCNSQDALGIMPPSQTKVTNQLK